MKLDMRTDGSDQGDAKGRNKRRKVASEANYHIGYKAERKYSVRK